ncbi:MAG: helix-turn-helix domain-containing protein [Verrucomicrobia bacterium]|nr:helix-turn-helix domain-containing protein [Verrucomicrobiota bacterium]
MSDAPEFLKPAEAYKFLRIGRDSFYRLVRQRKIPVIRHGKKGFVVSRAVLLEAGAKGIR